MYQNDFKYLVKQCLESKTLIGSGNPNAKILFVGKEGSNHNDSKEKNINENLECWKNHLESEIIPMFNYSIGQFPNGHTWRKYQILHDYIFQDTDKKGEIFENNIFTTEMNQTPSKRTGDAQRDSNFNNDMANRKSVFFKTEFIQNFKVVVLACSNYIRNTGKGNKREIDTIFGVSFCKEIEVLPKFKFWIHYNDNKTKLVIHCRQLSDSKFGSIPDDFLRKMGEVIREFQTT